MSYDKKVQINFSDNVYQASLQNGVNNLAENKNISSTQKTESATPKNSATDNEYIDIDFKENNENTSVSSENSSVAEADENELIIKQLEAEIEKLKSEYEANQNGKGIAGNVGGFFSSCKNAISGKGFKDTAKVELDEKIALLNTAKSDPTKLTEAYKTIMGADLTDEIKQETLEAQNVASDLSNEEKQVIVDTLKEQAASLKQLMEESKDNQGWFSKAMGGINNLFGFGTNSIKADSKIENFINQVNSLSPNDSDFAAKYQALTGETLSLEGINELSQGISKVGNSQAAEAVMDYEETQDAAKEIGAGILTSLATATCVIAAPFTGGVSIALGAAVGGASNVLINATDTIGTDEKYSFEQGVLDFGGGAINGAVTAMTLGSANLAGKGLSVLKGSGSAAAKQSAKQMVSGGFKNTAKNAFAGFGRASMHGAKIAAFSSTSNYMLNTVGTNALYDMTGNYTKSETPSNIVQNEDGTYSVYYELTDSNTGKAITYEIETVDSLSQDENGNLTKGNVLNTSRANDFNFGELAKQTAVSVGSAMVGSGIGKITGNIINPYATTMTNSLALGNVFEIASDMSLSLGADYLIASAQAGQFVDKEEFFSWDRILGEGRNQIRGLLIGIATSKVNNYATLADDALGAGVNGKTNVDMADIPAKTGGDVKLGDSSIPKTQQQIIETAGKLILEENNPAKAGELLASYGMKESEIETFFEETIKIKQNTKTHNATNNKNDEELTLVQKNQIQEVRKNYASAIGKELNEKFDEAYEQFKSLFKEIATDVNPIKKNNGNTNEISGNIMYGRAKGVDSLGDKIVKKIKDGEDVPDINAARKLVADGIGTRLIIDEINDENMQAITDKLCKEIENGNIQLTEINNYRGENLPPYFSDKQIDKIKDAVLQAQGVEIKTITGSHADAVKASGYSALQMNVKYKNGALGEIQIRGKEMDQVAEIEHVPYDIRKGKQLKPKYDNVAKQIKALDDKIYDKYQEYWKKMFEYAIKKERGISYPKPELPEGVPKSLSFEELQKI